MSQEESPSTNRLVGMKGDTLSASRELDTVMRRLWTSTSREEKLKGVPCIDDYCIGPCVFCQRRVTDSQMAGIIRSALFKKYCSAQRKLQARDISILVSDELDPQTLKFQEVTMFASPREYLSRFYSCNEFTKKFAMLWKFHQFSRSRPGMFDKRTFEIIYRNYYDKRLLHEKAIRKMLSKLSKSELQAEVDLDKYMKDSVVIEEDRRANMSKVIDEQAIQPIKLLQGQDLRGALQHAIQRHHKVSPEGSYQMMHCSGDEARKLFGSRLENIGLPSFVQGSARAPQDRRESKPLDLSNFFGKYVSDVSMSNIQRVMTLEEKSSIEKVQLLKQKAKTRDDVYSNKENLCPNISLEPGDGLNTRDKTNQQFSDVAERTRARMETTLSKPSMEYTSKQSKISGLHSTRDEDVRPFGSRESKKEEQVMKSQIAAPTFRDKEAYITKQSRQLKIMVPDTERLEMPFLKSGTISMKSRPQGEIASTLKRKVTQGLMIKPKKRICAADIEKFLRGQTQVSNNTNTVSQVGPRQTSKDKRIEPPLKSVSREKKSTSKEPPKAYFVSKTYGMRPTSNGSASNQNSRAQSRDKGIHRLAQTAHQLNIPLPPDAKMKTLTFLDNRSFHQSKGPASFMSTRRLFDDKVQEGGSRKKNNKALANSNAHVVTSSASRLPGELTGRVFFAKLGKDAVKFSKMVSPKGNSNQVDRQAPHSQSRLGRQEIFESLRRFRKSSANRSGLGDTTKQSIKCPKPKKKKPRQDVTQEKRTKSKTSRLEAKHQGGGSVSCSREGLGKVVKAAVALNMERRLSNFKRSSSQMMLIRSIQNK